MRLFALLLVPGLVFATEKPVSSTPSQSQSQNQHQAQSQSQGQYQNASASAQNSLSLNYEDRLQIPFAPAVFAPSLNPSHPCALTDSKGFSIPIGGASRGESRTDEGCERREDARVIGAWNPALALKIMCQSKHAKEVATPEDCVYVPAGTITKADLDRVESESKARDDAVFRQTQKK